MIRLRLAPLALAILLPSAAWAADVPTLRAEAVVAAGIVTIGDLIDGAGDLAAVAIFRSPDLGQDGTVPAATVIEAAAAAGLSSVDAAGLASVHVARASRPVEPAEMTDAVRVALGRALAIEPERLEIVFDALPALAHADPNAAVPFEISSLSLSTQGRRFDAALTVEQGDVDRRLRLSGTATEMREIVLLRRALKRGEVAAAADLQLARVPAARAPAGAAASIADIAGLAAQRSLRPGAAATRTDFSQPFLVTRGGAVTIVYRGPGLTLSSRGRALDNGTADARVSVSNLNSGRIVEARVIAEGTVEVTGRSQTAALVEGTR